MSRYSRHKVGLYKNKDDRSSFGESHMETALTALNQAQQKAAAVMAHLHASRNDVIHMLLDDDSYNRLRAVHHIVESPGNVQHYGVVGANLHIDFNGSGIYPFKPTAMKLQTDRSEPLLTFLADLARVHWAYEEVRGTLKWLNRNATPGAIRYYWPSAMKLVETSPIWADLQEVPTRFTIPAHITDWSQIFKDTATTVSSMAMLPNDAVPRIRDKMWVTFPTKKIEVGANCVFATDAITYNV